MLEQYFVNKNSAALLKFSDAQNLEVRHRRSIVNIVVDFMLETFKKTTFDQRRMTAKATVMLFPCLEFKESRGDGTVNSIISFPF